MFLIVCCFDKKSCIKFFIHFLLQHKGCQCQSIFLLLGGDWRMLAQRIGVSTETIQFWRRLNMKNPMEQVLTYWKDSKGATVRMLHRHLKHPQINALVPAKLISDFYAVD